MNPYEPPQPTSTSSASLFVGSLDPVVVEINYTPDFIFDALRRIRSLGITRKVLRLAKYFAIVVCAFIALLMIFNGIILGVIFWGTLATFLTTSGVIDRWWTKRILLRSPFINEQIKIEFSNAGLHATSPSQDVQFTWSSFTKMVRFDDGFLLMRGPSMCNWIPYNSIVGEEGLVQLTQFFDSKIGSIEDRRTTRWT